MSIHNAAFVPAKARLGYQQLIAPELDERQNAKVVNY
jgi:hypothetical protein